MTFSRKYKKKQHKNTYTHTYTLDKIDYIQMMRKKKRIKMILTITRHITNDDYNDDDEKKIQIECYTRILTRFD